MAGQLKYTLVVRHPDTLEAVALIAGSELPKWATELVDPGNLESGKSKTADDETEDKGYAGQKPADLAAEAEKRNLEVEGTGANGKVLKADLVAALEADDAEVADDADDAANSGA